MSTITVLAKPEGTNVEIWQDRVARKQEESQERIPAAWRVPSSILEALGSPILEKTNNLIDLDIPRKSGILSEQEIRITENYTVSELLQALRRGLLTSLEVTTAFCKRAAIAQQLLSCLTETFFDEALERARFLDECHKSGKALGPLHGLPISLKDSFHVRGHDSTVGFVSCLDKKATENAAVVDVLLELGAVIYVKTNIPQTMMTADSHNNIFGRTLNPRNTALNAGGSSGGEGALVAFRGSPLGIGTDIAGSIRIPALCCGTYGFKPTSSRIPFSGQMSPALPGLHTILPVAGPLANDFEALTILTKSVINAGPARLDVAALDVPWRPSHAIRAGNSRSQLTIGILGEDPAYPLHPPVKRALNDAISLLESAGHNLISIPPTESHIASASENAVALFALDAETSKSYIRASGEPLVPSVAAAVEPATNGTFIRSDEFGALDPFHRMAALSVKRHWIQDEWRKIWVDKSLDAVIAPASQNTACRIDRYGWPAYTVLLNLLDYPSCIIPFSHASKTLDPDPVQMQLGQSGPPYEPDLTDGAPCSIQIFTGRMRDEECLVVGGMVDECLNGNRKRMGKRGVA